MLFDYLLAFLEGKGGGGGEGRGRLITMNPSLEYTS